MCRLLAYLGPEVRLGELLVAPEHSLEVQAYRPREMTSGVVNADGFGVAWYQKGEDAEPGVYKSVLPIWADANLASLGRMIRSHHVLAYIRSATPGQPTSYENTQPFVSGRYSFLHNGFITRFRDRVMRPLRDGLPDGYYQLVKGSTDSEHLFATWLGHLRGGSGTDRLKKALELTVRHADSLAREAAAETAMTMVVSDGESMVALRAGTVVSPPSLYVNEHSQRALGATIIASEPLWMGESWRPVPLYEPVQVGARVLRP